jgi:acyl dehydratase
MEVGHRFERTVRWTRDEITSYATLVGDSNPLHHDEEYARSTRFGGLIASGAQTVAFLMALCGSQTTKGAGVGLEFNFRLLGPARPDDDIVFAWEVTSREASERPRGTLVELAGVARGSDGKPIVTATARTLLFDGTS